MPIRCSLYAKPLRVLQRGATLQSQLIPVYKIKSMTTCYLIALIPIPNASASERRFLSRTWRFGLGSKRRVVCPGGGCGASTPLHCLIHCLTAWAWWCLLDGDEWPQVGGNRCGGAVAFCVPAGGLFCHSVCLLVPGDRGPVLSCCRNERCKLANKTKAITPLESRARAKAVSWHPPRSRRFSDATLEHQLPPTERTFLEQT